MAEVGRLGRRRSAGFRPVAGVPAIVRASGNSPMERRCETADVIAKSLGEPASHNARNQGIGMLSLATSVEAMAQAFQEVSFSECLSYLVAARSTTRASSRPQAKMPAKTPKVVSCIVVS